jgi:putative flippase GtrA
VNALAVRWIKFNFVGGLGISVQLAVLALLANGLHMRVLPATAIAVETAVLHNFMWHERFTWKDRTGKAAGSRVRDVSMRLLRFHAGNGLISILGNLALMWLFVSVWHWRVLIANGLAIAVCSLANFAAAEWFVFRR